VIVADGLVKTFRASIRRPGRLGTLRSLVQPQTREVRAVDGVSFAVAAGECVGYLGPNGAGKSTTIKMLTGILVPTAGRVEVGGLVPHRDRRRNAHQIGVVFGHRSQLLFDLPVRDSFELLRYMYRLPVPRYRQNLARFAEVLEIGALLDRPVRTLSLGQRMRCEILAALLHEPRVLFLDEPTIGLDVVAKDRIRAFVEQINREDGVTVVLTTHDLADIERLCRRVVLIDKGRVIYDGDLAALRDRLATERQIALRLADEAAAAGLAAELAGVEGLETTVDGRSLTVRFDLRRTSAADVMRRLLASSSPEDLVMREESIEALVRRIYREGIGEGAPSAVTAG
jgi:ABC-2 type transport system ATP-binding protein